MIKVTILVPTNYNSGAPVPADYFTTLQEWFVNHFDGVTIQEGVKGAYRMADGAIANDSLISYSVVCEKMGLYSLSQLAGKVATGLYQECVYLEWHDINVEFVKPNEEGK